MGCYLQKKSKEILLIQSPTSADYLSVCSFWKHIGKNRDVSHESLLILLNSVFCNPLMLCNTYLQVTISPFCAFL